MAIACETMVIKEMMRVWQGKSTVARVMKIYSAVFTHPAMMHTGSPAWTATVGIYNTWRKTPAAAVALKYTTRELAQRGAVFYPA